MIHLNQWEKQEFVVFFEQWIAGTLHPTLGSAPHNHAGRS